MENDTDRLPQLDGDTDSLPQLDEDSAELADTIVLTDSNIMETRELRQLLDPDASETDDQDGNG